MIYAIIDIGSNTVRLSVYKTKDGIIKNLFNEKKTTSLASYIDDDSIMSDEGINKLIAVLMGFEQLISNFDDIDKVYAIATASIRNAKNSEIILDRVKKKTNIDVIVLTGEQEAKLAFIGSSKYLDKKSGILTDIGGGSSEIVVFNNEKLEKSVSLNIGSLNSYKKYVKNLFPSINEKKEIDLELKQLFEDKKIEKRKEKHLFAVGGSARASLQLYNSYYNQPDDNMIMQVDKLKKLLKYINNLSFSEKLDLILKIKADRVHTLLPGIIILLRMAKYFDSKKYI